MSGRSDAHGNGATVTMTPRTAKDVLDRSELPRDVRSSIERVVRRSRLWPSERIEVACELVAHFRDGLEAGLSAEQLLKNFGDAEQAAHLIRRAKKRNRPVWWRTMRRTSQGIALLIAVLTVFYLALAVRYYAGEPTIRHDYVAALNAVPAVVPDEDRAWPKYREALAPLKANLTLSELRGSGPDHEQWLELRAELTRHADDLARLRKAAAMPGLGFLAGHDLSSEDRAFFGKGEDVNARTPLDVGMFGVLLPYISSLRTAAQVLVSDAYLAAEEADHHRLRENITAMLRIAAHAREHPTLINQLVSFAVMQVTFNAMGELLAESPEVFRDDDLQSIAHAIAALAGTGSIGIDLSGERMFFEDFVQRLYTDDGRGGGRVTSKGLQMLEQASAIGTPLDSPGHAAEDESLLYDALKAATGPAFALVMADRRELMSKYNEIMAVTEREMAMPLWRAEVRSERMIEDLMSAGLLERSRYLTIGLMMPAIRRTGVTAELVTQRRDAVQTAIALEIYRRHHGEWPDSLDDLVPHLLPSVPPDRFDGKPLRYAVLDGRAVLYSIGSNHEDNGGQPAIGRDGEGDPDAASRWFAPQTLPHRTDVPHGDWILWESQSLGRTR